MSIYKEDYNQNISVEETNNISPLEKAKKKKNEFHESGNSYCCL